MRKSGKRVWQFDFTTVCPLCGGKSQPNELRRTGWYTVVCPHCKQEYKKPEPPKGYSTS
jgi:hypothetical protein